MDTKNLQQKLSALFNHIVTLSSDMHDSALYFCPSEKGLQMRMLRMSAYRFLNELVNARRLQDKLIIDVIGLNLIETNRCLHELVMSLVQSDCDIPLSYCYNGGTRPIYDAREIVEEENLDNVMPEEELTQDFVKDRRLEIETYTNHFEGFSECVDKICDVINKLFDDSKNLERDEQLRMKRLNDTEDFYLRYQWQKDKAELNKRIDIEYSKYRGREFSDIKILGMVQDDLYFENVYETKYTVQYHLNKNWKNRAEVAKYVAEHRNVIFFDDMMNHLRFCQSDKYITELIETKKLMMPCQAYEGKLFTSVAAYELARMLGKAFYNYIGFDKKVRSAFVCAAMSDLKIMMDDMNNNRLKAEFFNNEILGVNDKPLNKDDVSKSLRSCTGRRFCTIDENNLRDYTADEFKIYKESYWRAFSIINKVTRLGDKLDKAPYLETMHPIIDENDVLETIDDDEKLKIKYIVSALSQNWE